MAAKTKNIRQLLNDLIHEPDLKNHPNDYSRIVALNLPVERTGPDQYSVQLDRVYIFDGIELIVSQLLEQVKEACFLGLTDIVAQVNVERNRCRQLHDLGIHRIFFYSAIENLEDLPVLHTDISHHLKYIFNALQSFGISYGFFKNDQVDEELQALLFPFHRAVKDDKTGFHYLVERNIGSHFIRITVENQENARLNLRKINHRIISQIELIPDHFNLRKEASVLFNSIINRCRDGHLYFKDSGWQLGGLIEFLRKSGYEKLSEVSVGWPRSVSHDVLVNPERTWLGNLTRLLLIVSDSTTRSLLLDGKTLEVRYSETVSYLSLTQLKRNLQIDLHEKMVVTPLSDYLVRMEQLNEASQKFEKGLESVHLVFIHHFTSETLAVLGAFDKLELYRADTLWVKYSGQVPPFYIETILSLPDSVYRFFGLQQVTDSDNTVHFILNDHYSSFEGLSGLADELKTRDPEFFEAMQLVALFLFFDAICGVKPGIRVVIAEDGGYLAPLINRLALENGLLGDVFLKYGYRNESVSDDKLNLSFSEWLKNRFLGSVEHTRNGFDALFEVEKSFGKLAFPACSLAVSDYKIGRESVEVACSCLNAIENILNSQGYVLNNRNCLVMGSLGAIGRQTMNILSYRLEPGHLTGVDVQSVNNNQLTWTQSTSIKDLPEELRYSFDLIFGVVGKSVLDAAYFAQLLVKTTRQIIFLASGSTKRFEFLELIEWVEELTHQENPAILGFPVRISVRNIEDPQTGALQGSRITFELNFVESTKVVEILLLGFGMPINFQYYGVPRETMDRVMTEFVSLVSVVAHSNQLPSRLLALDRDIDLTGHLLF